MNTTRKTDQWWVVLIAVVLLGYAFLIFTAFQYAKGAEHNHLVGAESELHDKFYSTWMRPNIRNAEGQRMSSCCNKEDCRPAPIRQRGTVWEAWDRVTQSWIAFSAELLEQNQPDPIESPDAQPHACILQGNVLCATLGAGV